MRERSRVALPAVVAIAALFATTPAAFAQNPCALDTRELLHARFLRLGALGGVVTTPVINKPEVAIVGVNKIDTRPVWDGSGFTPRRLMNLSSSFDHRVIDGFDAASFIRAVKTGLEQPALLFVSS